MPSAIGTDDRDAKCRGAAQAHYAITYTYVYLYLWKRGSCIKVYKLYDVSRCVVEMHPYIITKEHDGHEADRDLDCYLYYFYSFQIANTPRYHDALLMTSAFFRYG